MPLPVIGGYPLGIPPRFGQYIHHDPTCPTLNAHRVTDGLGRELWAVWCDHCDDWHWHGPLAGHRIAHCHDPASPYEARGYNIQLVERAVVAPARVT